MLVQAQSPAAETPAALAATPEEAIAFYRPLVAAGRRYFIPQLAMYDDLETARLLVGRVFPVLTA